MKYTILLTALIATSAQAWDTSNLTPGYNSTGFEMYQTPGMPTTYGYDIGGGNKMYQTPGQPTTYRYDIGNGSYMYQTPGRPTTYRYNY